MDSMNTRRRFLKSGRGSEWETLQRDQDKGVPRPPFRQPYPADAPLLDQWFLRNCAVVFVWRATLSNRMATQHPLSQDDRHGCRTRLPERAPSASTGRTRWTPCWAWMDGIDEFTLYVAPVGKVRGTVEQTSRQ